MIPNTFQLFLNWISNTLIPGVVNIINSSWLLELFVSLDILLLSIYLFKRISG